MEAQKRYAAIDIGSNAIRLLVAQVMPNTCSPMIKKLSVIRVPIRLGEDVFEDGIISEQKSVALMEAIQGFHHLLNAYEVEAVMACATSAMREAKNGDQITERIEKSTGIKIEIISGAKEAEIIFSAGIAGFEDVESTYFYIDVGGGSTELTIFSKGRKISSKSFPIGTVRQLKGKVKEVDWRELKEWLKDNLTDIKIDIAIGSGGNINKLLKLIPEKRKKDKYLSFEELKSIYGDLSILTEEERMVEYGLNQDRADVIVPAAKVFLTLMHWANIDEIAVPKFGLADGLVRKLAEENY